MEPSDQENLSVQNENQSIHSYQENLEQSQKYQEPENNDLYDLELMKIKFLKKIKNKKKRKILQKKKNQKFQKE